MPTVKFDIKKDNEKRCFCLGCLVGKKQSQMSQKDIRYCLECQPVIEYEYLLLADKSHAKRYQPVKPEANLGAIESPNIDMDTGEEETKMSTLNCPSSTVDKFRPRGRPKTYKKRELPEELIKQLSQEMGSKAIVTELRNRGINVSYKTIQRLLTGQRVLV